MTTRGALSPPAARPRGRRPAASSRPPPPRPEPAGGRSCPCAGRWPARRRPAGPRRSPPARRRPAAPASARRRSFRSPGRTNRWGTPARHGAAPAGGRSGSAPGAVATTAAAASATSARAVRPTALASSVVRSLCIVGLLSRRTRAVSSAPPGRGAGGSHASRSTERTQPQDRPSRRAGSGTPAWVRLRTPGGGPRSRESSSSSERDAGAR